MPPFDGSQLLRDGPAGNGEDTRCRRLGWEGWPDIRRAVERLSAAFRKEIRLVCDRKLMMTGAERREDLKAIWGKVFSWSIDSDVGYSRKRKRVGGRGWKVIGGGLKLSST